MKSANTPKRLKVLIVRNSSGAVGGAELSALDQAVVLKSMGHYPVLISGLKKLKKELPNDIENHRLFETTDSEEAVTLVLAGLKRCIGD